MVGLSTSKYIKNIETITLRNMRLTSEVLEELVSSPNFSSVKRLDVGKNFELKDKVGELLL